MVPSPQDPTGESRGDRGDVPKTGWREETRCVASQSALGWGDSLLSVAGRCPGESVRAWLGTVAMWRCGRCVASQSALGWGDSLLSVAGRCPGESVRPWLGTVAMWRVSASLIGDCRYVACGRCLAS
ncbi:hypothetical protein ACLB2K_064979 [Fragaria x ananassa]